MGGGESIRIRPLTVKPSLISWWAASYATTPPKDQPERMGVVSEGQNAEWAVLRLVEGKQTSHYHRRRVHSGKM